MALLSLTGVHGTNWVAVDANTDIDEGAHALVSLDRLSADAEGIFARAGMVGVTVGGDTDIELLAAYKDRLALVAIEFPAFNDGRGFSLAVRLRRDLGFKGELRAVGHVIPDQAQFLMRAGFDTAELPDERADAFTKAAGRYKHFYQCTINGDMSVAHMRHMAKDGESSSEDAA